MQSTSQQEKETKRRLKRRIQALLTTVVVLFCLLGTVSTLAYALFSYTFWGSDIGDGQSILLFLLHLVAVFGTVIIVVSTFTWCSEDD